MDIVKAFNIGDATHKVQVVGTTEAPLFSANDIGKVLELSNIRKTMVNLPDDMKVVTRSYTAGGEQQATFVTEEGLYEILSLSRSPIARTFRRWVYGVLKEIRLTGQYDLKSSLEKEHESKLRLAMLESQQNEALKRHRVFVDAYKNQNVVYVAQLLQDAGNLIKVGSSKDIKTRQSGLKSEIGEFLYVGVFPCTDMYGLEAYVHNRPEFSSRLYKTPLATGKSSTEVVQLDEHFTVENVLELVRSNTTAFEKQSERIRQEQMSHAELIANTINRVLDDSDFQANEKRAVIQLFAGKTCASSSSLCTSAIPNIHTDYQHPQQQCVQQYSPELELLGSFDSITMQLPMYVVHVRVLLMLRNSA